jgi:ubiA prenyltransferase
MNKLAFFMECTRAYSLPMSVTAWAIAFFFGVSNHGNIFFALTALAGIICAHLGANLFDDILDYKKYLKSQKDSDNSKKLNFKKGKCKCFLNNELTVKTALKICAVLFFAAILTGLFFAVIYKLPIILIMAVTGVLCLLYPRSGYAGLSEIIIGTIFSPLLFTGVYYVMTGALSYRLLWLSLSFAFVTVCLLYTDFFLDFNQDKAAGKKTIPILTGSKQNAYYFYIFIIFMIYALIFVGIHSHLFPLKYAIIFLSVIPALGTVKRLQHYIDKEIKDEKEFLSAMNNVQKFVAIFAILCIVSFF